MFRAEGLFRAEVVWLPAPCGLSSPSAPGSPSAFSPFREPERGASAHKIEVFPFGFRGW